MAFEKELPEWKATGIEPPSTKINEGWKPSEKPPADWLNWTQNKTYEALKELQEKAAEASDLEDLEQLVTTEITDSPNATPLSLVYGRQVIDMPRTAPFTFTSFAGRTLVNLLGRDGNCESLAPFTTSGTVALSTTQYKSGTNSIKSTNAAGISYAYKDYSYPLDIAKQYVLGCWVYLESYTSGSLHLRIWDNGDFTNLRYNATVSTSTVGSWQFIYVKIPTSNTIAGTGFRLQFGAGTSSTAVAYFDGVRLYEVSATEYATIGTTYTGAHIDARLPYVDDMKPIANPYMIKYGENLLPPFSEWEDAAAGYGVAVDPYKLTIVTSGGGNFFRHYAPVTEGQIYNLSATLSNNPNQLYVYFTDASKTRLSGARYNTGPITAPTGAKYMEVVANSVDVSYAGAAGTFTFSSPMLNLGSTALPFKPRADDYLFFPNVQLASNVDGSIYDTLGHWDGKYWKQARFKTMDLDGGLAWTYTSDNTGSKVVQAPLVSVNFAVDTTEISVKYDSKVLVLQNSGSLVAADVFNFSTSTGHIYYCVSDTDSGWGESYAPSADEIKAYFYGFSMSDVDGKKYTGTGTKYWAKLYSGVGTPVTQPSGAVVTGGSVTTTLPITLNDKGYTPYKLQYQLVTPTLEEIAVEGDITLHKGLNQIEVGIGMIVRERITPSLESNGYTYANDIGSINPSKFRNRVSSIHKIYKNGFIDPRWTIQPHANAYGNYRIRLNPGGYDPIDVYTISYLAEQYSMTCNVLSVKGQYAANVSTVVDELSENQANIDTSISVLEKRMRDAEHIREDSTMSFVLEVRTTDPVNPVLGRQWLIV
jgi:hypothetical protein